MGLIAVDRPGRIRRRLIRRPSASRVLFVTAATHTWEGEGSELYRREPIFRDSVHHSAQVAGRFGFENIAQSFAAGAADDSRERWVCDAVLHAALLDLWRGMGVRPEGVVGVGLGELTAAYAAQVVSREELVAGLCQLILGTLGDTAPLVTWSVEADTRRARQLCARAPAPLRHLGTYGPGMALLGCDEHDQTDGSAFLEREVRVLQCSRRPPLPLWDARAGARPFACRSPSPNCPIFSSAVGRRLSSDADLGALGWTSSPRRSFYFDEALADAVRDGFDVLITIGAEPPQAQTVAAQLGTRATVVRSLGPPGSETDAWERASRQARGLGLCDRRLGPIGPRTSVSPATFDFRDPRVAQDPYPCFEELRRQGPIHWLSSHKAWLVLNHAGVTQMLLNADDYEVIGITNTDVDRLRREDLAELRRLMRGWLNDNVVERVAAEARAVAGELTGGGCDELDVVSDIAQPLSDYVAGRLLGLERAAIDALSDALRLGEREPTVGLFVEAIGGVAELPISVSIIEELKRRPSFSQAQVDSFIRDFWVAAALTSRLALPSAVLLLLEQPPLQAQLRAEPHLLPAFVNEALRLYPPGHTIERTATADVVVAGTKVSAGSELYACIAAANRDPARFEDPTSARLDRPTRHVTFGFGPHRCPGARMGQSTIAAAVAALLEVGRPLREAQPLSTMRWADVERTHTLEHLRIRWD